MILHNLHLPPEIVLKYAICRNSYGLKKFNMDMQTKLSLTFPIILNICVELNLARLHLSTYQ